MSNVINSATYLRYLTLGLAPGIPSAVQRPRPVDADLSQNGQIGAVKEDKAPGRGFVLGRGKGGFTSPRSIAH